MAASVARCVRRMKTGDASISIIRIIVVIIPVIIPFIIIIIIGVGIRFYEIVSRPCPYTGMGRPASSSSSSFTRSQLSSTPNSDLPARHGPRIAVVVGNGFVG